MLRRPVAQITATIIASGRFWPGQLHWTTLLAAWTH